MRLKNVPGSREAVANCAFAIDEPGEFKGRWAREVFDNDLPIYIEVGMGKGKFSLLWTTINELICAGGATFLLGFVFHMGIIGIWWGFVLGRGVASICNFIFARLLIKSSSNKIETN